MNFARPSRVGGGVWVVVGGEELKALSEGEGLSTCVMQGKQKQHRKKMWEENGGKTRVEQGYALQNILIGLFFF